MDFLSLVRHRRSVRRYTGRPVERDKLERCLEAARLAPSANNGQPWRFVVVDEPGLRARIAGAVSGGVGFFNRFAGEAPALVVVVREAGSLRTRVGGSLKGLDYRMIDVGIAAEHFCLQAVEEGLGTCILGWFDAPAIRKALAIPASGKVALVIAVGHPAEEAQEVKARKGMDEFRSYNRY